MSGVLQPAIGFTDGDDSDPPMSKVWTNTFVHIHFGVSTLGQSGGFGLHFRSGNNTYKFRVGSSSDFSQIFNPEKTVAELGFLYLRRNVWNRFYLEYGAGLGYHIIESSNHEHPGGFALFNEEGEGTLHWFDIGFQSRHTTTYTIGIPVEIQFGYMVTDRLYFSLNAIGKLNRFEQPFALVGGIQFNLASR